MSQVQILGRGDDAYAFLATLVEVLSLLMSTSQKGEEKMI